MVNQSRGFEQVGFKITDLHNQFTKECNTGIHITDSRTLIAHLVTMTEVDADLFFMYTIDYDNILGNIFCVDSIGSFDYNSFYDVVAFDATYEKNAYGKPLVFLVGINHNYWTIIFGMALIVHEVVDIYTWLLKIFLDAMKNKHPQSVVTDGDKEYIKLFMWYFPTPTTGYARCI